MFFRQILVFGLYVAATIISGVTPVFATPAVEKMGVIRTDEIWRDKVRLVGDVKVPEGVTLRVAPHTIVLYEQTDRQNLGTDNARIEIVAEGQVIWEEPWTIRQFDVYHLDADTRALEFAPRHIDPAPLKEEFRKFRHWYGPLWFAITYGILKGVEEHNIAR